MPNIFCSIIPSHLTRFSVRCHIDAEASFITVPAESPLSAIVSPLYLLLNPFVFHRLYSSCFALISFLICETLSSFLLGLSPPFAVHPSITTSSPAVSLFIYLPFPTSCRKRFGPSPLLLPCAQTDPPPLPPPSRCLLLTPLACASVSHQRHAGREFPKILQEVISPRMHAHSIYTSQPLSLCVCVCECGWVKRFACRVCWRVRYGLTVFSR